jgi:hypothetical protein
VSTVCLCLKDCQYALIFNTKWYDFGDVYFDTGTIKKDPNGLSFLHHNDTILDPHTALLLLTKMVDKVMLLVLFSFSSILRRMVYFCLMFLIVGPWVTLCCWKTREALHIKNCCATSSCSTFITPKLANGMVSMTRRGRNHSS